MDAQEQSDAQQSARIDKKLEQDSKNAKNECKILLLGSGESGKSTIVKQMKIIHQNGYSVDELLAHRQTIYTNLIDCAKTLVQALKDTGGWLDLTPQYKVRSVVIKGS